MASDQITSNPIPEPRPPLPADDQDVPPDEFSTTPDDRNLALLCHIGAYFTSFIVPLVVYLIAQKRSPFLAHHGREALNFQISQLIYLLLTLIVAISSTLLIGLFASWESGLTAGVALLVLIAFVFLILETVLTIMASVAAWRGQFYRYPLCIRLVR
jgi:uncharacterized Tic20 family protein